MRAPPHLSRILNPIWETKVTSNKDNIISQPHPTISRQPQPTTPNLSSTPLKREILEHGVTLPVIQASQAIGGLALESSRLSRQAITPKRIAGLLISHAPRPLEDGLENTHRKKECVLGCRDGRASSTASTTKEVCADHKPSDQVSRKSLLVWQFTSIICHGYTMDHWGWID